MVAVLEVFLVRWISAKAQRAVERGTKRMRNFHLGRAEQAPFCAMFL
jgi:hypothetical protein